MTASIVELVGLPGAGKSTVYRELMRGRLLSRTDYLGLAEALLVPRWRSVARALEAPWARVLVQKVGPFGTLMYTRRSGDRWDRLMSEYWSEYERFFKLCLEAPPDNSLPNIYRMMGVRWIAETVERYAQVTFSGRVIVDEGITQKVHAIVPRNDGEWWRSQYFSLMPRPEAIVYLDADPKLVARRIQKRWLTTGRKTMRHVALGEYDLISDLEHMNQGFLQGLEVLRRRGVPVFMTDASLPLAETVTAARGFLSEIQ